jgi:hypothetical protein
MAVPDGWPPARVSECTEPGLQASSPAAYASDLRPSVSHGLPGHFPGTSRAFLNALSRASRARPLASGTRCPYRSTVVVIDLWPSQREISEIGTPSATAVLAQSPGFSRRQPESVNLNWAPLQGYY